MKKQLFTGSACALVTPMLPDGEINYEVLSELVEFQLEGGSDALVIADHTGENVTLSDDEHMELVEQCVLAVNRRAPVIVGVSSTSTAHAIRLAREASIRGADGLLLSAPLYSDPGRHGLVKYFLDIAEAVGLPVILSNEPMRTGALIDPCAYKELAAHPLILASREGTLSIRYAMQVAAECGDELALYAGRDEEVVPMLSIGALGAISPLANLLPQDMHDICHLYFAGRVQESLALQMQRFPLCAALEQHPAPALKAALSLMEYEVGGCRAPLTELEDHEAEELKKQLAVAGLI